MEELQDTPIISYIDLFWGHIHFILHCPNRKLYISAIDYTVFGESRENHFLNPSVFVGYPLLIFILSALLYTTITNHPIIVSRER